MKRLYTVRVKFEFAVLAESEHEARYAAGEASEDGLYDATLLVSKTVVRPQASKDVHIAVPSGWDNECLVYGADEDTKFGDAVAAELEALVAEERVEEFKEKQSDLFSKDKP